MEVVVEVVVEVEVAVVAVVVVVVAVAVAARHLREHQLPQVGRLQVGLEPQFLGAELGEGAVERRHRPRAFIEQGGPLVLEARAPQRPRRLLHRRPRRRRRRRRRRRPRRLGDGASLGGRRGEPAKVGAVPFGRLFLLELRGELVDVRIGHVHAAFGLLLGLERGGRGHRRRRAELGVDLCEAPFLLVHVVEHPPLEVAQGEEALVVAVGGEEGGEARGEEVWGVWAVRRCALFESRDISRTPS